jgi:hypothetical protein
VCSQPSCPTTDARGLCRSDCRNCGRRRAVEKAAAVRLTQGRFEWRRGASCLCAGLDILRRCGTPASPSIRRHCGRFESETYARATTEMQEWTPVSPGSFKSAWLTEATLVARVERLGALTTIGLHAATRATGAPSERSHSTAASGVKKQATGKPRLCIALPQRICASLSFPGRPPARYPLNSG